MPEIKPKPEKPTKFPPDNPEKQPDIPQEPPTRPNPHIPEWDPPKPKPPRRTPQPDG